MFYRGGVESKHLMCFRVKSSVFKFLLRTVNGALVAVSHQSQLPLSLTLSPTVVDYGLLTLLQIINVGSRG